jgi:DNA-directed RNA polymerase specialized sigma24 family protein
MTLAATNEAELLALMALQRTDQERAKAAWEELFVRHRRYLFAIVSRSYGSFLGPDGTIDLVVDTFRRAYEWAGRQLSPEAIASNFTASTPDSTRRRVLGWLGAIAERLFRDRFRDRAIETTKHDEFTQEWLSRQDSASEPTDSSSLAALRVALAALTPSDADALRVSLPWYDPSTRAFMVPRGEATRLAALLGTTTEALRQRRHRAIKRLGEQLQAAGFVLSNKEQAE